LSANFNLGMAFKQKGSLDAAIAQFQTVLKIEPGSAEACYNLGNALVQKGSEAEAIADFQRALKIKPGYPDAMNDLAWELATAPQAALRNGSQAVQLAQQASQLAGDKDPDVLDTLAAAYAEAGRYDDAVQTARKAIELVGRTGQSDRLAQFNTELELYQANRPFHREGK
jgi:tetratricopeptide (TPR) repeat protein